MEQVVIPNYSLFKNNPDITAFARKHPKLFSATHGVELAMAEVGGYKFIDASHCDFDDGSECKTASVLKETSGTSKNVYACIITNVATASGNLKTGALRVCVYNPHLSNVTFYFIPNDQIERLMTHSKGRDGRILSTWNKLTGTNNKLDPYKVADFETLAKMKA